MDRHEDAAPDALLTPDEYVWRAIADHPSLYAHATMERARLAAFDQLLNVTSSRP